MTKADLLALDKLLAKFQQHVDKQAPLHPAWEAALQMRRAVEEQIQRKEKP